MRTEISASQAFKRLVRSFNDSLISQMYKQIVRQPSLTTSYGADVAKSFMASAARPEFGKKILRALETLNKKNALDRTMPELALVIAVLRQAKDFCRQYVHEWPKVRGTTSGTTCASIELRRVVRSSTRKVKLSGFISL